MGRDCPGGALAQFSKHTIFHEIAGCVARTPIPNQAVEAKQVVEAYDARILGASLFARIMRA